MPTNRTRRDLLCARRAAVSRVLALIDLLSRDAQRGVINPLAPKAPHFPAKAKHAVFLFMNGAPSHIDTFDPKPVLTKFNGTPYQGNARGRFEQPADRQPDAVAVRVSKIRAERAGDQQSVSAHLASSPTISA